MSRRLRLAIARLERMTQRGTLEREEAKALVSAVEELQRALVNGKRKEVVEAVDRIARLFVVE